MSKETLEDVKNIVFTQYNKIVQTYSDLCDMIELGSVDTEYLENDVFAVKKEIDVLGIYLKSLGYEIEDLKGAS